MKFEEGDIWLNKIFIDDRYWISHSVDILFEVQMGNKQGKVTETGLVCEHPSLQGAKVLTTQTNNNTIQAKFKVQHEQYDEWNKNYKKAKIPMKEEYLFVPQDQDYSRDSGLCGNTGTVTVNLSLLRISTPTIPSSSLR